METFALTVSDLNNQIKRLFENEPFFRNIAVKGELSNVKLNRSGHIYFSLKDADSVIRAVMFRSYASNLRFRLEDGLHVLVRCSVSVYIRDGAYQLYATEILPDGVGTLYTALAQLKIRLEKEGLFSPTYKKALPAFPGRIALITSSTGAAVRDMIRILGSRWPLAKVLVVPVPVQGTGSAEELVRGIRLVNHFRCADIIIVGRGGGSIEDLWSFNEESLARAIFSSTIPLISAVGHETDFSISDFVADVRASTPSNAAELAVPDIWTIRQQINALQRRILLCMQRVLLVSSDRFSAALKSKMLTDPLSYIQSCRKQVSESEKSLLAMLQKLIDIQTKAFLYNTAKLEALNPLGVLIRGYAIVRDSENHILSKSSQLTENMQISVNFADGKAMCHVDQLKKE